jgi:hypothetical protein
MTIISAVSFWDDVKGVNQKIRLAFHLFAMTCVFYLAGIFGMFPWWAIVMGVYCFHRNRQCLQFHGRQQRYYGPLYARRFIAHDVFE